MAREARSWVCNDAYDQWHPYIKDNFSSQASMLLLQDRAALSPASYHSGFRLLLRWLMQHN